MTEFLPYGRQQITEADIAAVCEALGQPLITQGPTVASFEEAFASEVGAKHAVAFTNGTAALHAAAHAAGLGPGDDVLTTPISFVASANCALFVGARPRFADIDRSTANLDTEAAVEAGLASDVRACVAVSMAGHPVNLEPLQALRSEHGLIVIEDASHALGGRRRDPVGGDGTADMVTFSLHPVKHITTGEGGMVATDDPNLAARLNQFRNHGIVRRRDPADVLQGPWHYEVDEVGFNYRITDFQCALGLSQLSRLASFIDSRNQVAQQYRARLSGINGLKLPADPPDAWVHAYHLFVVRFAEGPRRRAVVYEELREAGIGTQLHYIPIPRHPLYRRIGYQGVAESLLESEAYYAEALSLPMFVGMTARDVDRVGDVIERSMSRSTT